MGNALMKIKRFCLLFPLFLLTSCGLSKDPVGQTPKDLISVSDLPEVVSDRITESVKADDKELKINVLYDGKDVTALNETRLEFDEDKKNEFINSVMYQEDGTVEESTAESGEHCWNLIRNNQLAASCSLDDRGWLQYDDIYHDINCPYMDDDGGHIFEYGYITSNIPAHMTKSAKEIAGEYAKYLSEYSCFSFEAWNVLAGYEPELDQGDYDILFQAVYDNLPVTINIGTNTRKFSVDMIYSNGRVIKLFGPWLFKAENQKKVNAITNPFQIIDEIKKDFTIYAQGENSVVEIDQMRLEYFPKESDKDSYLLVPVWNFHCTDTRHESVDGNEEQEIKTEYNYVFYAEDGKLCDVFL